MVQDLGRWDFFQPLTWDHVIVVSAIFASARLLGALIRRLFGQLAEKGPPRLRMTLLRSSPILRLLIGVAAVVLVVPILVEPTLQNVLTLIASVSLAIAFALKDYASSLVAGVAAVLENVYQPGDWIEFSGEYGEVKTMTLRAVRIVTADDTEVIIPHSRLWSTNVANATSGGHSLPCVARFYLHPEHDALAVRRALEDVAVSSDYREPDSETAVLAAEQPWGTEYKVKAYVHESRKQFEFISDLTVRGKTTLMGLGVRFAQAPYAPGASR